MEGRSFGVDVKGAEPFRMERGPICLYSANHKQAAGGWRDVDVQAFEDRCYIALLPHSVPPKDRTDVGDKMDACNFCRVQVLTKYCPFATKMWEWVCNSKRT